MQSVQQTMHNMWKGSQFRSHFILVIWLQNVLIFSENELVTTNIIFFNQSWDTTT